MRWWVLIVCTGCGRIWFDELTDASSPSACWNAWLDGTVQLAPPELLALSSPNHDRDPYLTADGLTLYFSTGSLGNVDIHRATRASLGSSVFTPPEPVSELNSIDDDLRVSLTADELVIVFSSDRAGGAGNSDLWTASRSAPSDAFSVPERTSLGPVNTTASELDPELTADGLRLYLAPNTPPQGLALATRSSRTQPFSAWQPIAELNVNLTADPSVSPDERVLALSSSSGSNEYDIYFATRAAVTDAFSPRMLAPTINLVGAADGDPSFSRDGCELFFSSDRAGTRDLYIARVR